MCTMRTYNAKMDKLSALKAQIKELENEVKELETYVKENMGDAETIDTGRYIIRYTRYTSSRFDSKTFSTDHPKLAKEYTRPIESRRFSWSAN